MYSIEMLTTESRNDVISTVQYSKGEKKRRLLNYGWEEKGTKHCLHGQETQEWKLVLALTTVVSSRIVNVEGKDHPYANDRKDLCPLTE